MGLLESSSNVFVLFSGGPEAHCVPPPSRIVCRALGGRCPLRCSAAAVCCICNSNHPPHELAQI